MYCIHRGLQTQTLASLSASSLNKKRPLAPPPVKMHSVRVTHGRTCETIQLPADATVADLKQRAAELKLLPTHEALVMSRGKKISDEAVVADLDKVMLLRVPAAAVGAAQAKKVHVTLRCLASARCARDVELSTSKKISAVLDEIVKPALGLTGGVKRVLFLPQGRQLLRDDLCIEDYPQIVHGTELFVAPNVAEQPTTGGGDDSGKPRRVVAASPSAAGPALAAMAASLPSDHRAAFEAAIAAAPSEELRAVEAMSAHLDRILAGTEAGTDARLTRVPAAAVSSSTGAKAQATAEAARSDAGTAAAAATAGGAEVAAHAGAAGRATVPLKMASGRVGATGGAGGGVPMTLALDALDAVPGLREDLEKHIDEALKAAMEGGGGANLAAGGLMPLPLPPGMCVPPGAVAAFSVDGVGGAFGGAGGGLFAGVGGGDHGVAERERLEAVCGRMVDKLETTAPSGSGLHTFGGGGGSGAAAAPKPQHAAKAAKAAQQEFGKGLKVGFLNRPRKKRRQAAAAAQPTAATSAAAEESATAAASADVANGTKALKRAVETSGAGPSASAPRVIESATPATSTSPGAAAALPMDVNTCCVADAADDDAPRPPAKKAASDRRRCTSCCVRLPLTAVHQSVCRCGGLFCAAHLHSHVCSHDYRGAAKERLRASNPEIAPSKLL